MKSNPMTSNLFTALRLLLACLVLSTAPAWAADYTSLVGQAREQLQDERFVEALATAKDAVRANPNDYKGHYYVAMAYMGMNRLDDADAAVNLALGLAPANAKPGVEKLEAAIKTRRQSTGSAQAADAAMVDGLTGKAARLYEEAWNAGKDSPELGMKAASLYARLNQPVDAARVLRQVGNATKGSPAADTAEAELAKLSATLRKVAEGYVMDASGKPCDVADSKLQQAEEADPSYAVPLTMRASCAARLQNLEGLQSAIKKLAKLGLANPDVIAQLPKMRTWLSSTPFNRFLVDLMGQADVDAITILVEKRWARYEEDLVKYREDSASYESRVNAQKIKYAEEQARYEGYERNCLKKGGFFGNDVAAMECIKRQYDHWHPEWKDIAKPVAPVEPK